MPASEARRTSRSSPFFIPQSNLQAPESSMVSPGAAHADWLSRLSAISLSLAPRITANEIGFLEDAEPHSRHVMGFPCQQSQARMRCPGLAKGSFLLWWVLHSTASGRAARPPPWQQLNGPSHTKQQAAVHVYPIQNRIGFLAGHQEAPSHHQCALDTYTTGLMPDIPSFMGLAFICAIRRIRLPVYGF